MTFLNEKKTFLAKLDRSKKGEIDEKVRNLLSIINPKANYYTTSSCSGRVYLWKGTGKKNETEWLKVSHDLITEDFLKVTAPGLVWLRVEPLILHIACQDLASANRLLTIARKLHKKSGLLSISKKIIVEIRGSEFLELPLYLNKRLLFDNLELLLKLVNAKMNRIFAGVKALEESLRMEV